MAGQIVKAKVKKDFVQLKNTVAQNDKLSWQALGLLTYLLSLPDDWVTVKKHLYKLRPTNKRASTDSAFKELEDSGYIMSVEKRNKFGHFKGFDYIVYNEPPNAENQHPDAENPIAGNPIAGNQHLQRNTIQKNKEQNGESSSLFSQIKNYWLQWYIHETEMEYYFTGKDGRAITNLIKQIEFSGRDKTEGYQLRAFRWILDHWHKLPAFYLQNRSLTIINSKFNEIINILKNGQQQAGNNQPNLEGLKRTAIAILQQPDDPHGK